jgi:hypothetical protein
MAVLGLVAQELRGDDREALISGWAAAVGASRGVSSEAAVAPLKAGSNADS